MVCEAFVAETVLIICGAAVKLELPAWLAITEQAPEPLVMVYVEPETLHAPALVNVTPRPLEAVAVTVKVLLYAALAGTLLGVIVIVCEIGVADTVLVTCAAGA